MVNTEFPFEISKKNENFPIYGGTPCTERSLTNELTNATGLKKLVGLSDLQQSVSEIESFAGWWADDV